MAKRPNWERHNLMRATDDLDHGAQLVERARLYLEPHGILGAQQRHTISALLALVNQMKRELRAKIDTLPNTVEEEGRDYWGNKT